MRNSTGKNKNWNKVLKRLWKFYSQLTVIQSVDWKKSLSEEW
jgi:hypothetical protein